MSGGRVSDSFGGYRVVGVRIRSVGVRIRSMES